MITVEKIIGILERGVDICDAHTCAMLEYDAVIEQLARFSLSEDGEQFLRRQRWITSLAHHHTIMELVTEYQSIIDRQPDNLQFPPVTEAIELMTKEGAVCEAVSLRAIACYARSSRLLKQYAHRELSIEENRELGGQIKKGKLGQLFHAVPILEKEEREIFRLINDDGTLCVEHIPVLQRLARRMGSLKERIRTSAGAFLRDGSFGDIWNSDIPTQREGRTVLAVKSSHRGKINGIVHALSESGATVYIEPHNVVELNNELIEYEAEYMRESLAVLRRLTNMLQERISELHMMVQAVKLIDTIYVRACYSREYRCTPAQSHEGAASPDAPETKSETEPKTKLKTEPKPKPELEPKTKMKTKPEPEPKPEQEMAPSILLKAARHPLLKKAQPIDVVIDNGTRGLLITGPNAGGKTIALKTVGLLALMNQFAVPIPAASGSTLLLFHHICADIGDEQSLHESLSTFSGHICNITNMLNIADSRTLVLLDELGTGTEHEEGSALAMAIVDRFMAQNSTVVATSHSNSLKEYAYHHSQIAIASVEFDLDTFLPTYRLIMGVAGSSYAIQIARNVGLPPDIVAQAQKYRESGQTDIAQLIEKLHTEQTAIAQKEIKLNIERRQLEKTRAAIRMRTEKLEKKERELEKEQLTELAKLTTEGRRYIERMVFQKQEIDKDTAPQYRKEIAALEKKMGERRQSHAVEERREQEHALNPQEAHPGMRVRLIDYNKIGTLVRADSRNNWLVETNTIRLTVPFHRLERADPPDTRTQHASSNIAPPSVHWNIPHASYSLNILGKRLPEAEELTLRQIEWAIVHGISKFDIIHGTGEGILKNGIRALLDMQEMVARYEYAPPEEGGFGKTVVYLQLTK